MLTETKTTVNKTTSLFDVIHKRESTSTCWKALYYSCQRIAEGNISFCVVFCVCVFACFQGWAWLLLLLLLCVYCASTCKCGLRICARVYVSVFVCVGVYMKRERGGLGGRGGSAYIYLYICVCVCVSVCVCVFVYVCVHTQNQSTPIGHRLLLRLLAPETISLRSPFKPHAKN